MNTHRFGARLSHLGIRTAQEKGNAAFAAKKYEEAEGLYSEAIAMLG